MKVQFIPESNFPARVCSHRYGALATISQCTDLYSTPSSYAAEMIGFKHNISPTFFLRLTSENDIQDVVDTGRCGWGVYFLTAYWYSAGAMRGIPDYDATTWTSAGQSAFSNAVAGQPKPARFPNHGQELYDVSGGVYGYDYETETAGSNGLNEITGLADALSMSFFNQTGKTASVISYQNGEVGIAPFLIAKYLAGRNSDATSSGNGRTAYGKDKAVNQYLGTPDVDLSKLDRISQASTTRFWDNGKNLVYCQSQIDATILNRGWYNDFIHYHSAFNAGTFDDVEEFYQMINEATANDFVWKCGYEEAMEYMWLRESIEIVVGNYKNGKARVYLRVSEVLEGMYNLISTPISVEIDLGETPLSGKDVKSNYGQILSLGADKYVIDVPLNKLRDGVFSFIVEEAESQDYLNFAIPEGSMSINENTVTVTTDLPTRAVLFTQDGEGIYDISISERDNVLSTTHVFDITGLDPTGVGIISKECQSNFIEFI